MMKVSKAQAKDGLTTNKCFRLQPLSEKTASPTPLSAMVLTCALTAIAPLTQSNPALAQQPQKSAPLRTTSIPCPTPVAPEEVEGKTTLCGVLTVPEDYSKPNGRQIEITYSIFKSLSLSPQPDPLLVLHGGPGGSDIANIAGYTPYYAQQRQLRDVILFDQRGSRYSGDGACSPALIALSSLTSDPKGEWAAKLNNYTKNFASTLKGDVAESADAFAAFKICADILTAHGFDLGQYNTSNNARDVTNLATALGYDKVNLYGISYGTYLAMRVMRDYPQRVRSVVLDSTIPPHVKKYDVVPLDLEVVLLNLIEDCQKDAACNAAYPNLKARAIALVKALDTKPIPLSGSEKPLTAGDFANLVESINGDLNGRKAAYLPLIIAELEKGVTTTYTGVVSGKIFPTPAKTSIFIGRPEGLLEKASELKAQARKLLTEKAKIAESRRPSQQWVQQAITAIETLPEKDRPLVRANLYGVGFQRSAPRDRKTLIDSVADIFPANLKNALTPPLKTMSEAEIRHVYEALGTLFRSAITVDSVTVAGVFRSFDCQDLAPPSTLSRSTEVFQSMQMPGLGRGRFLAAKQAYTVCQFWPVKPAPLRDREVVRSAIPTLVLQSRYDAQTNTTVGSQALAGLTNGTLLEFPNSGHGALIFSQCARDVGAAFVNNPSRPPKADCREALKPKFVLPTATK